MAIPSAGPRAIRRGAGAPCAGLLGLLHHEASDRTHPAVGLRQRAAGENPAGARQVFRVPTGDED